MHRENARSFEQMTLMAVAPVILTGVGEPERLEGARVSASFFPMLGIQPALGRTFNADEEVPGRHRAVLLGDDLWRRRFGADASVVGRTVRLNDEPYVVAGVLPRQFRFPALEQIFVMGISGGRPELWMPFAIADAERGENSFAAIAKLRRGVSAEQARAELSTIQSRFAQQIPNPPQLGAEVVSLQEQVAGSSRDMLTLLWTAIAAVLVIACGNITNLLLVRTAARRSELAIRGALGASRRVLLRHSLVDSLTLAVLGGMSGVLVALWALPLLIQFAPSSLPRLDEVAVDARALTFAALVTMTTGLVVGLLPAHRAAGANLIERLRVSARTGSAGRRDFAGRGLTVSMQTAVTVACLGAAGLVTQSLANVLRVDPGFETDRILTLNVGLSPGRYPNRDARAAFVREALQAVQNVPGVDTAAAANRLPLNGISVNSIVVVEGTERAAIPMLERPLADIRSVNAGYFETFGIPLLHGALFHETHLTRPVAVIAAAAAKRAWPDENPIGKRFRLGAQPNQLIEVVGVVGDVRNMGLETSESLAIYLPYWQGFLNDISFALKTTTDAAATTRAVRAAITEIDSDAPVQTVRTMASVVNDSVAARSFQASVLILFEAHRVYRRAVSVS